MTVNAPVSTPVIMVLKQISYSIKKQNHVIPRQALSKFKQSNYAVQIKKHTTAANRNMDVPRHWFNYS
jgi:hypothetical protein